MLIGLLVLCLVSGIVLVAKRRNAFREAAFLASIRTIVFDDDGRTIAIAVKRPGLPLVSRRAPLWAPDK
jgi:hypothetical protein